MSDETPALFLKAGCLGCQVDRVRFLHLESCRHTPSTFQKKNAALTDSHILNPVSQIQTEGKGGTEIQTTALNIYMDLSEHECVDVCVCMCVCAVSLLTRMYSFANIYSVFPG